MREESHLDDMRAAIRGDFERLAERRGGQGLMRASEDDPVEESSEGSLAERGPEPETTPETTPELAPAAEDARAPAVEDAPVPVPEPEAEAEDAAVTVSEPDEDLGEPPRRSWLARLFGG